MKYLVIIITIIAIIACEKDSPDVTNSITTENKYTIEELENDTNWVEVTEIDTVGVVCGYNNGSAPDKSFVIRSTEDLSNLEELILVKKDCEKNQNLNIDFLSNVVIVSAFSQEPSDYERRIFKNKILKEIRYIFSVRRDFNAQINQRLDYWTEVVSLKTDFNIICDTLKINTGG